MEDIIVYLHLCGWQETSIHVHMRITDQAQTDKKVYTYNLHLWFAYLQQSKKRKYVIKYVSYLVYDMYIVYITLHKPFDNISMTYTWISSDTLVMPGLTT